MAIAAARAAVAAATLFLLLMDRVALSREKVQVPGECSPTPYRRPSVEADDSAADLAAAEPSSSGGGGLHLDCLLSAINSKAERTNFSVIPAEHTVSLTVRCANEVARSQLEPQDFLSLAWLEELGLEQCNLDLLPPRAFVGLTRLRVLKE